MPLVWAGETAEVVASAPRTARGNSGPLAGYGPASRLRCQLHVTAASGTAPTLDVIVQDTLDGETWNTIGTFAQKVTTGREVINIADQFADTIRVKWAIGGTDAPSFTFSVIVVWEG